MLLPVLLAASLSGACLPDNGVEGICGPVASEDLARIPGTHWLIASGLNIGQPAHLYLLDTRSRKSRVLFPAGKSRIPSKAHVPDTCPGPLLPERMSLDGLGIRAGSGGAPAELLAANHGDRHAIEFFRVDVRRSPSLTWTGCVPMPKGTLANAVVPLSDGGMLVSSFHDPDDRDAWNRMDRGEPTGGVWEWHADRGWKLLTPEGIPGANGIELSADERTLYVSAWAASQLLVIDRSSGATRRVTLDFRPDNIHRTDDGTLLVGGQRAAVRDIAACTASCPQPWLIARFDPRTDSVATLLEGAGTESINYACGALEVDGMLFMTLRGDARVAWKAIPRRDP